MYSSQYVKNNFYMNEENGMCSYHKSYDTCPVHTTATIVRNIVCYTLLLKNCYLLSYTSSMDDTRMAQCWIQCLVHLFQISLSEVTSIVVFY